MTNKSTLVEEMQRIVDQSGSKAMAIANKEIASKFASNDDVSIALNYFARVTLRDALPVFPALVSLSCEAVGGNHDKTDSIGGAITLIAGAADLHDDVIDQSPVKNGKLTVLGKFGKEIAILAGDALLVWGLVRFREECESVPGEQGGVILDLLTQAILEMVNAEALEARLRAEKSLSVKACMNVIELKAVVPEVSMKLGAILGNGSVESVDALGHFGKIFGIVSTVAEEFMDVLEFKELQNRLKNDYPPLPVVYALQDSNLHKPVFSLAKNLSTKAFQEIKKLVLNSQGVSGVKKEMNVLVQNAIDRLYSGVIETKALKNLDTIIKACLELLEGIDN